MCAHSTFVSSEHVTNTIAAFLTVVIVTAAVAAAATAVVDVNVIALHS